MTNPVIKLADYQAPDWLIETTELLVVINENRTEVEAQLRFVKNGNSDQVVLNGESLETLSVEIDGQPVSAEISTDLLEFTAPSEAFTLTTRVAIVPESNTQLEGLYKSGDMYCTQCEAEGFRRITWYADRPDVLSRWTVTIDAPLAYPTLLSNGNKISEHSSASGRRRVVWQDPHPKPCYLFAMVAGDLVCRPDRFTTQSSRLVDIMVYTRNSDATKVDFAIESIKQAMAWDEKRFGREYDLDVFNVVAVSDFNMGAMENKGLNIFNTSCVLATPDIATDAAYERVEAIIGHEYFHNWSGNRVTCRDWFQLSLKEGFTVYRDAEFTSDLHSRSVKRIQDVNFLRTHQFAEDAGPTRHPVRPAEYQEISNFYTVTVYEKGAEVVGMLATLLGDQFRAASDLYFERFDGQAVTCDDFIECMQAFTDHDLTQFKRWYSEAGTPQVTIETQPSESGLQVTITQQLADCDQPLMIPLRLQAYTSQGEAVCESQLHVLTDHTTQIEFDHSEAELLSVNQGFSAPVLVNYPLSDEALLVLASHDQDPFNRWDAAQTLIKNLWMSAYRSDDYSGLDAVDALWRKALENGFEDPAYTAEVLSFPDSAQIIGLLNEPVDPIHLEYVRVRLLQQLGERLAAFIHPMLSHLAPAPLYEPSGRQAGRRRLWQAVVGLLAYADDPAMGDLLSRRFVNADNLTDRMGAMRIAALSEGTEHYYRGMLGVFYTDWNEDELLMDQWFQVQAAHGDLASIEALLEHEDYALANPNRARSVLGPWARSNPKGFHSPGGYERFADVIGQIEAINPQIASRLVLPLTQFEQWQTAYRDRAYKVLKALQDQCQSKDMSEILSKALKTK